MPRTIRTSLAAVALVVGLGFALALSGARAQDRSATRWEYRVFAMDVNEYAGKSDYKTVLDQVGPRKAESAFQEHVLGYLGKEGWELVHIEQRSNSLVYLYLKRPVG